MSRWAVRLVAGGAILLAVAFVVLSAVGGGLYWNRVELRAEQLTRETLGPLAEEQIPAVFGYDYQTVERSLTEAYDLLTPSYREEFRDRATKDIIPQAREREVVSQANVRSEERRVGKECRCRRRRDPGDQERRRAGGGALSLFCQAEDGIRVFHVTGVQTCALPISRRCSVTTIRPWSAA